MRLIDANEVVRQICNERDKIPRYLQGRPYELGTVINRDGDLIRGGLRKALHIIETSPTISQKTALWNYCPCCGYKMIVWEDVNET